MSQEDVLVFDLKGKFAHFKKFYSNSSSLSYAIPPRTAIIGILASVLKKERDKYYGDFSPEKCKISVSLRSPIKKHFETVKYLANTSSGTTNVPLEIVLPSKGVKNDTLNYRIFLWHKDDKLLKQIENKIKNKNLGYGIYLGQRQFKANIDYVGKGHLKSKEGTSEKTSSIVKREDVESLDYFEGSDYTSSRMSTHFSYKGDGKYLDREVEGIGDFIFNLNGPVLRGNFSNIFEVTYREDKNSLKENISFFT